MIQPIATTGVADDSALQALPNDFGATASDTSRDALHQKLLDAQIPGFEVDFDPAEADIVGAFIEDAMSETDARENLFNHPGTDVPPPDDGAAVPA